MHRELGNTWYGVSYTLRGRFIASARKRRQIQHDTSSFDANFKQALVKAIDVIANEADERLKDAKDALSLAEDGLVAARDWLTDKLDGLSKAKKLHNNNLSRLEKAKVALLEAKKPFEMALSRLNNAQRDVDNLCTIKSCTSICVPGLKCRICWKRAWIFRIPYPCCRFTHCMIRIPNPLCVIHNSVCFTLRRVAFLALEGAKLYIRGPMIALDQARSFLTVVQIAVGETELLVGLAEVASINAQTSFETSQALLRSARRTVEDGRELVKIAAPLIKAVAENFEHLIVVENCGFNLVVKTTYLPVFDVYCTVILLSSGRKNISFEMNFNNPAESLWNAAREVVRFLLPGISDRRKKRDVEFNAYAKANRVIRKIRDTSFFNTSDELYNEEYSSNMTTDYQNRVSHFAIKCALIRRHQEFLNDVVNFLFDISKESKQTIDGLSEFTRNMSRETVKANLQNLTRDFTGVNVSYAAHYNLSRDSLEDTIEIAKENVSTDPVLVEIDKNIETLREVNEEQINNIQSHGYADTWIFLLENVTKDHYNQTECVSFRDCILHLIGDIIEEYAEETHANTSAIKDVILDIQRNIFRIVKNTSFDILGIYERTSMIKSSLEQFSELNIYCAQPPIFLHQPNNLTSVIGGNVTFYCKVQGDPIPYISWYKSNNEIPGEHSEKFILYNVSKRDSLEPFSCRAENLVANITSDDVYLTTLNRDSSLCEIANGGCEQRCSINVDSVLCSCYEGYEVKSNAVKECKDIDECLTGSHKCQHQCTNTFGSYRCSCLEGFILHMDKISCLKAPDVCTKNGLDCSNTAGCNQRDQEPSCFCPAGYILSANRTHCEDLDECEQNACEQVCNNTLGSYECSCFDGFEKDSETSCKACSAYFWGAGCINSCSCVNAIRCDGQYGCICQEGWRGEYCDIDFDECTEHSDICKDTMKTCHNFDGFYICTCPEGFMENEQGHCSAFKDCTGSDSKCQHICMETQGIQKCDCLTGFHLGMDNSSCLECKEGTFGYKCEKTCACHQTNTERCSSGNGDCTCKTGWTGVRCDVDVDECDDNLHPCPPYSQCRNTIGGYVCSCDDNYLRSGNSCIEILQNVARVNVSMTFDIDSCEMDLADEMSLDNYMISKRIITTLELVYMPYLESYNIILHQIREGSVIVDHRLIIDINNAWMLTNALVTLAKGDRTVPYMDNNTRIMSVTVHNRLVRHSDSKCEVYQRVFPCTDGYVCIEEDGRPSCRSPEESISTLPAIVATLSGAVVFIIMVAVVFRLVIKRRRLSVKHPGNRDLEDNPRVMQNPAYDDTGFSSMPWVGTKDNESHRYSDVFQNSQPSPVAWENPAYLDRPDE